MRTRKRNAMDEISEKELEQLRRLDLLRKQVQIILKNHIFLLALAFVLFLGGILTLIYVRVTHSSRRYIARISLHYYPKQPGKIGPYNEKFMLQMFNRPALMERFRTAMHNREYEGLRPSGNVEVHVERKPDRSFSVVLHACSEQEAVTFTNGFARLCIQEYINIRTAELKEQEAGVKAQKQKVYREVQEINQKKAALTSPLHVISPEKDFERLRVTIANHRAARTKLSFVLRNLQTRQKRLQEELGKINPMLLGQSRMIKEYVGELKKLDNEISINQELYTEENPKLKMLLSRRKVMEEKFGAFLKKHGLTLDDIQLLEAAEKMHTELLQVQAEYENKEEELRVLDSEITNNQRTFDMLTQIMPQYQELNQQAGGLLDSLQKLDESIADINYLLVLAKDDLFITEGAAAAIAQSPFRKKNLAIALFTAIALTGLMGVLIVLQELLFGVVADEQEMVLRPELRYLGRLPVSEQMFRNEAAKELTFNTICHRFQSGIEDGHVVLSGALPGSKILPDFFTSLEWTYAMSGKRFLLIDIVLASSVDEELPMEDTGIIAYSGSKGSLPITSKKYIAPSELELIKQDIATLRKHYDMIFFRHSFSFRHDKLFLEQFIPLCDGLLVALGFRKTARKNLRTLSELQKQDGVKVMTILSDKSVSHFNKVMNMENQP